MNPSIGLLTVAVLAIGTAIAGLNPGGADCGEQRCSTVEYCSPYDKRCKPCSSICDATGRNYQQNECIKDCQEYLHDKRYVLLEQYEDLRGEMQRLWILAAISIAVAFTSLVSSLYLYVQKCPRWEKMRTTVSRAIAGKRAKRTSNESGGGGGGVGGGDNDNDNNNDRGKSTLRDAESGTSRHNGLKLTMPTISASVAPSRFLENENGRGGNGSGNASGSGSANGSGTGNATPNTTTTSLSRRHPSEDTTLDYAYDNPAMTPSPETVQHRTKRESSF
ncbi:uncharacterized protein LOC122573938 [Bombus pyrosoma]|uniref:uncharacterized protein LOC122573938 n=1 Tax=Bombus pyrosoma TaxID=396416 RepID=UPI001CB965CB|nr:uncharacterized protein LOC122573938 [Bombus pyrosoma]